MRKVMQASVIALVLVALLACFAVAQDAVPKPKVSATVMGQLPAPAASNPAPAAAPKIPPLGSLKLVPPQWFLDAYSSHTYEQICYGWECYVIREQSRAIVALQTRMEALEKAAKPAEAGTVEQVRDAKPAEPNGVK